MLTMIYVDKTKYPKCNNCKCINTNNNDNNNDNNNNFHYNNTKITIK